MGAYADLIRLHDTNFVFMTLTWVAVIAWLLRLAPALSRRAASPRVV
jgi:hypothetical protein